LERVDIFCALKQFDVLCIVKQFEISLGHCHHGAGLGFCNHTVVECAESLCSAKEKIAGFGVSLKFWLELYYSNLNTV
jgi:hypothetical protein